MPRGRPAAKPEHQLILLSAGTAARRLALAEHARRLAAAVDWPALAQLLRSRGLLTLLGPRIRELSGGCAGGDEFADGLDRALAARRRQSTFLQLVSAQTIRLLADAGIRCSPLKGPQLGERLYGDLGRRPSSDVDLLVVPEQLHAAVEVVRRLGYGPPTDRLDAAGLPALHLTLAHERDELPPVELHWRIHWYEASFARDRLLAPAGRRLEDWRPLPEDELASLLLFYARDGFVDLRLAADLGAWWDAYGDSLRAGALADACDAHPALARALRTGAHVAGRLIGLPVGRLLGGSARLGLRERAALRLANPNPRASLPQLYADIGMIDALLLPAGEKRAFVRRQLLPSRQVLEERARAVGQGRVATPPGHALRVVARYAVSAARITRAPESLPS